MRKTLLPAFYKTKFSANAPLLFENFEFLFKEAKNQGSVHIGRGNIILDLTYIDRENLRYSKVRFAGSSTERAVSAPLLPSSLKDVRNRLMVGRQTNPLSDDRNHNRFKSFAEGSYTQKYLQSLGEVSKVTFALLDPNSWWPSHFDFSCSHAAKLNIPVVTNDEVVSVAWNPAYKRLDKAHMKTGEVWWLNSALKHTSFNWGNTPRLFLLATYIEPDFFIKEITDEIEHQRL